MIRNNDSAFKNHESCPKCNSKDNLARYDDGHAWCFGCGHYEQGQRTAERPVAAVLEPSGGIEKSVVLPSDASTTIDNRGLNWLHSYGITRPEIIEHNIKWSDKFEQLLFPVYGDKNDLVLYQARSFHKSAPKWLTYGKTDEILHILGLTNEAECGIVLVEDLISAIKVSRHIPAMPLFGNNCSSRQLTRLSRVTDRLFIWLDPDMRKRSHIIGAKAQQIGLKPKVIYSNHDPKSELDDRIQAYCTWSANV